MSLKDKLDRIEKEIQNYSELKMKIEKITTTNNGEHP